MKQCTVLPLCGVLGDYFTEVSLALKQDIDLFNALLELNGEAIGEILICTVNLSLHTMCDDYDSPLLSYRIWDLLKLANRGLWQFNYPTLRYLTAVRSTDHDARCVLYWH